MIQMLHSIYESVLYTFHYSWPFVIWACIGLLFAPYVIEHQLRKAYQEHLFSKVSSYMFTVVNSLTYMVSCYSNLHARSFLGAASSKEVRAKLKSWQIFYTLTVLIPFVYGGAAMIVLGPIYLLARLGFIEI